MTRSLCLCFFFFLFSVRAGLEIFRLSPFVKGVPNQLPRDAEEAAMARAHWPVSLHTPATGAAASGAAAGGAADCAPLDADGVPVFAAADRLKFDALWRVALEQARQGAKAGQLPRGAVVVSDRHRHSHTRTASALWRSCANARANAWALIQFFLLASALLAADCLLSV